jgi:hypothetical protein
MRRPDWNNRFYLTESKDNQKVHEYFRQYFDKPRRKRQTRIMFPEKPGRYCPSLRSSLEKYSTRVPRIEKLGLMDKKTLELGWNSYFHVKVSKDNQHFYSTYREYFDSPRVLDCNQAVSNPVPVSVIGFRKDEQFRHGSADPRDGWSEVYSPLSQNNSKNRTMKSYFKENYRKNESIK